MSIIHQTTVKHQIMKIDQTTTDSEVERFVADTDYLFQPSEEEIEDAIIGSLQSDHGRFMWLFAEGYLVKTPKTVTHYLNFEQLDHAIALSPAVREQIMQAFKTEST